MSVVRKCIIHRYIGWDYVVGWNLDIKIFKESIIGSLVSLAREYKGGKEVAILSAYSKPVSKETPIYIFAQDKPSFARPKLSRKKILS